MHGIANILPKMPLITSTLVVFQELFSKQVVKQPDLFAQ